MRNSTPKTIAPHVLKFCQRISKERLAWVKVEPEAGADFDHCFPTILEKVERDGGESVTGWQIWEMPQVLIEAEFHAVWRAPEGSLHDLTPKRGGESRILFLPDPSRVYEGHQVDNIREPLTDSPAVRSFIKAAEAKFELMNRGARSQQHGQVTLRGAELDEFKQIERLSLQAQAEMLSTFLRPGRNDPCPCGNGKKFKHCHGQ